MASVQNSPKTAIIILLTYSCSPFNDLGAIILCTKTLFDQLFLKIYTTLSIFPYSPDVSDEVSLSLSSRLSTVLDRALATTSAEGALGLPGSCFCTSFPVEDVTRKCHIKVRYNHVKKHTVL